MESVIGMLRHAKILEWVHLMNLPKNGQVEKVGHWPDQALHLHTRKADSLRADKTSRFIPAHICGLHPYFSNSIGNKPGASCEKLFFPSLPHLGYVLAVKCHGSCDSLCDKIPLTMKCSMSGFIRQCDDNSYKTFLSEVYAKDRPPLMCGIGAKKTSNA